MAKRITPWNPNTADWLVAQRGKRTQDEIVDALAQRGVKIGRAWLSRIENGQQFGSELMDAFQELYGSVPPPFEPPEKPESSDLATALLTLAKELGEWRREREELTAKVEGLEELVKRLTAQAAGASRGRSVPDGTAG